MKLFYMTKKELKALQKRQEKLVKAIQKNTPKVIWDMVAELIEVELELEAECNK